MRSVRHLISALMMVALVGLGLAAEAQRRPYRITDRQVDQIIRRIEFRTDRFRASVDAALDRSRYNNTRAEDDINRFVNEFESATDALRSRFNGRTSVAADVENVLNRAALINDFMLRNNLNARAQNDWATLRGDLDALATAYGVAWRWDQATIPGTIPGTVGGVPYRVSDREVDAVIRRIEQNTDRYRTSLDAALDRSRYNRTRDEDRINQYVREFEQATDQLRSRFNSRSSASADVQNVLDRALFIDDFMRRNRLGPQAENDWRAIRSDLDVLAGNYNVAWNWTRMTGTPYGNNNQYGYGSNARLTGTYRLNRTSSEDPRVVADRVVQALPGGERQRVRDRIMARLEAPEMMAIERNGLNVTIASSRAPQTTFEADGRERVEQMPNGITSRVSARITGDQLVVSSTGYRENDFTVTFDPINTGRGLRVTRRIFSDRLTQPIVVQDVYDRVADVAQWDSVYTGSPAYSSGTYGSGTGTTASGDFIVPDGQTLVATLNNDLTTETAQNGDRFTMTVRSPGQFEGATIEGSVRNIDRGGRVTGRAGLTVDFDTIRLRDGRTYRFAGFIDSVRADGETVRVDNEGTVESGSRTTQTAQRAAIGTAVGAIIGAIAGGGKGAAIGAVIGAGAGAGSVYVQGKEDLTLRSGSEVTVRASSNLR